MKKIQSARKIFGLFLILALLAGGAAAAENQHLGIRFVLTSPEQEKILDADIYSGGETVNILSSLFTGEYLSIPVTDTGLNLNNERPSDVIRYAMSEEATGIILQSVRDWCEYMQPEIKTGMFSGDLFSKATRMEHFRASYADLMILYMNIQKALEANGLEAGLFREAQAQELQPDRNYIFDFKFFDMDRYITISIQDGNDTLMTVSFDLSNRDKEITVLMGTGNKEKNYYRMIRMNRQTPERILVTQSIYADDERTGWPGIRKNTSLIYTMEADMEKQGDENNRTIIITGRITPANSLPAIQFRGLMKIPGPGRIFEGRIQFEGYDDFTAMMSVDLNNQELPENAGQAVSIDPKGSAEGEQLWKTILDAATPLIWQMMTWLPPEYLTLITGM